MSRARVRERSTGVTASQPFLPPFQRFVDGHAQPVLRFLVTLLGPDDAEDAFQETFLAALRAYGRLPRGSNLHAWVMTIAHRKAMDVHRARRRSAQPVAGLPERAAAEAPDPEPGLWAAVRALPEGQRGALLLRHVADLPYRDVAAVLGCTEEAARQRVREAIGKLREGWR